MSSPEMGQMTGCAVIDPDSQKVGTVKDVVYDDRTMEMRWAVVEYGLTHHRTLVPASQLYKSEDGNVVTMLHKDYIKRAPRSDQPQAVPPGRQHGPAQLVLVSPPRMPRTCRGAARRGARPALPSPDPCPYDEREGPRSDNGRAACAREA